MRTFKSSGKFIYFVLIPLLGLLGYFTWQQGSYNLLMLILVVIALLPFIQHFESKQHSSRELVMIASLVSLTIIGRLAFFFLPSVSPVAAIVIICGLSLGSDYGFIVGMLSPLLSNVFFSQGPWTPFQMFAYGFVGLIVGIPVISKRIKTHPSLLILTGLIAGVCYSFLMDIWTVLSIDPVFTWGRYFLVLLPAIPYTLTYAISNVIFLLVMYRPLNNVLERAQQKYGLKAK